MGVDDAPVLPRDVYSVESNSAQAFILAGTNATMSLVFLGSSARKRAAISYFRMLPVLVRSLSEVAALCGYPYSWKRPRSAVHGEG